MKRVNHRKKLSDDDLSRILILQAEYGLSLSQCCRWLEKRRNVSIGRTTLYNRIISSKY